MDLLRLAGPPGVGKSTTAWAVARSFAADGVASGYVDTDQLGMCYPAPDDDSDRWALKERALAGVAEEFRRAGVDRLVVSGVAWPDDPPPQIAGVSVRSLWLDASEQTRRRRLGTRGDSDEQLAQFLSAGTAEAERVNSVWERLETDDLSASETVERVLARWQAAVVREDSVDSHRFTRPDASTVDRVLWITGPRLAGTSRIGWQVVSREWSDRRRAGFIDLAQLSFAWNTNTTVGLANLVRLHQEFRRIDTDRFVVVAPFEVEPAAVRAVLPASDVSFVRLARSAADLRTHALLRRRGDGPSLAGDDVLGATDAAIGSMLRRAGEQSSLPHREYEASVETRGLSIVDAATAVRHAAGW